MTHNPVVQIVEAEELYGDVAFPEGPSYRPYVVINMISTADGKATIAGRSSPIGSPLDRIVMRRIRAAADGLLIGAGTLRAEEVDPRVPPELQERRVASGLPPNPLVALLTASGDVPLERKLFRLDGFEKVVFVWGAMAPERLAEIEARSRVRLLDAHQPALPQVMRILRTELGVGRLVVEGGPRLNGEVIDAGYVDELFLTVAPKIAGGPGKTIVEGLLLQPERVRRLELVSLAVEASELFLRYRFALGTGPILV